MAFAYNTIHSIVYILYIEVGKVPAPYWEIFLIEYIPHRKEKIDYLYIA